jgi:hypothetical protein
MFNSSALDVLSLESLGLPRWWLNIGWDRWLELRWLKRVSKSISSKIRVLQSRSGMVYGTSPLLLLLFLLKDSFKSFLVWAIVCTVIIVLLVKDTIPFSFLLMASAPAATSASASAPSASAAAPLIRVWWTRWAGVWL